MLSKEEILLINELLNEVEISDKYSTLKCKLGLIVEQIKISEDAQEKMAKIQDKLVELNKDGE